MTLDIAPKLTLPDEAVTETFAILAKRGVGKTYTANVLAEEMLGLGAQVVVLDPLDAWWGLRSSADGKHAGLPIYVFGGEHADLPLDAAHGELIADTVVDHGISVVLSLRHLSKTKQRQFVATFSERLYHRKGEPEHRTPLHVFIDEADAFVPQRVSGEIARAHGAIDDLVRRGRSSGIGVTLITQRAAVISKDVLTQAEVLIALRTVSPQDRKALDLWVEAHDAHDQRGPFMESLASLAIGEAWVWSPGWLDVFERVHIRKRHTFDSSSTPKAGARPVVPRERAQVDLAQLEVAMAEVVVQAEANDPKKLKARVRELERQLAQQTTEVERIVETVEVPVVSEGAREEVARLADEVEAMASRVDVMKEHVWGLHASMVKIDERTIETAPVRPAPRAAPAPRPAATPRAASSNGDGTIGGTEKKVLAVLIQYPDGKTKDEIAAFAGYSKKASTVGVALSKLRAAGYVTSDGIPRATEEGFAVMPNVPDLPTGPDLLDYWRAKLGGTERKVLDVVLDQPGLSKDEIADAANYSRTASTVGVALSKLRGFGLVEGTAPSPAFADAIA